MDGGQADGDPQFRRASVDGADAIVDEGEDPQPAFVNEGETTIDASDSLAKAIASMLGGVLREFDAKAEAAFRSQDAASLSLDRLTAELDKLLEDAPLPFIMQHASKISGIRKRVSALNSVLKTIQRRIDNIDMMLSTSSSHVPEVTAGQES